MTIVYLDTKDNNLRLVISKFKINDKNYIELMRSEGGDERSSANAYCIGFINGCGFGQELSDRKLLNKAEEFFDKHI